jgi:anti-sigma regulatory factor (Ser/Thr protein kinase)
VLIARRRGAVTSTMLLPHAASSVAAARHAVARDLLSHGCPPLAVEDAVLVTSEILSNALKHARPLSGGTVRVCWTTGADGLMLEVTDGGSPTRPRVAGSSLSATGGRGLGIVAGLVSEWGVTEDGSHTTVWARLTWPEH